MSSGPFLLSHHEIIHLKNTTYKMAKLTYEEQEKQINDLLEELSKSQRKSVQLETMLTGSRNDILDYYIKVVRGNGTDQYRDFFEIGSTELETRMQQLKNFREAEAKGDRYSKTVNKDLGDGLAQGRQWFDKTIKDAKARMARNPMFDPSIFPGPEIEIKSFDSLSDFLRYINGVPESNAKEPESDLDKTLNRVMKSSIDNINRMLEEIKQINEDLKTLKEKKNW